MPTYVLSDLALDDLADIAHSIARDNPLAAKRVIARLFERFELIANQPGLGVARREFARGDLRAHAVGKYVIFYRINRAEVEVARVLHGARHRIVIWVDASCRGGSE